jgi:hypothetical protein
MTAPDARRRRLPLAELYVVLCAGLATLLVLDVASTLAFVAVLVLLFPAGMVVFAIAVNVVYSLDGLPDSWVWEPDFVLLVVVLAGLQAWMFRTMARNWRRTDVEMRPTPVTTGADTGL